MALEEVIKKSFADLVQNSAAKLASGMLTTRTYASVLAPKMTKTAVRIRIEGAAKFQPEELPSKAQEDIQDAYAIPQRRSNDPNMFVQLAFQRDAALNMRQPRYHQGN